MSKEHTTIAVTPEVRDQLKDVGKKGETYNEILRRLIAIEKYLAFEVGYTEHSGDALEARFLEQRRSQEDLKAAGEAERARKQKLVDELLKSPPTCEVCDAVLTPTGSVPHFEVGGWQIRSSQATSWFIAFECKEHNKGMGQHPRVTVYPDAAPRKKRVKSLTDGYLPSTG